MAKSAKKSQQSSMVVAVLAVLVAAAAIVVGVKMMSGEDDPVSSSSDASSSMSSSSAIEIPDDASSSEEGSSSDESSQSEESSGTTDPSSSEAPTSAAPTTSVSSAPKVTASASNTTPLVAGGTFNNAIMGDSGAGNIANYKKINSDVKGWIKIPGTVVNYPVLHVATGHYYLDKDIYKNPSKDGVIYADPYTKFGTGTQISNNTVLYGHNWQNISSNPRINGASDVMFEPVTAYHHLSFAQSHPYIYYSTSSAEMVWQVFAAFYTDIGFVYNDASASGAALQTVINGAKARSRHIFDVPVSSSDKILTLSTCTRAYGPSDQQRFVVMAKLIKKPSGGTFPAVNIKANPSPVQPNLPRA